MAHSDPGSYDPSTDRVVFVRIEDLINDSGPIDDDDDIEARGGDATQGHVAGASLSERDERLGDGLRYAFAGVPVGGRPGRCSTM